MTDQKPPSTEVIVQGRLSYAALFKPKAFKGEEDKAKYKTDVLIPKNDPGTPALLVALKAASDAAKKAKWGSEVKPISSDKVFLKDGASTGKPELADFYIVTASESEAPALVKSDGKTEIVESDGLLYSGAWARVLINVWVQDNSYGKRLNANLRGVQFLKHDTRFGEQRTDARAAFGSLEDTETAGLGFGNISNEAGGESLI